MASPPADKPADKSADKPAGKSADKKGSARNAKPKSALREWTDAFVFILVIMVIVRTLFFDLFRIPTPSMEKSLLVGDYLFVSKVHYGTRTPLTLGIPFTPIYVRDFQLPNTRFPGFTQVKRGDAIVFNFPPDDQLIDRKTHYIKRVVGMPGERLEIVDKEVRADGAVVPLGETMQQYWDVRKSDPRMQLSGAALRDLGVSDFQTTEDMSVVRVQATPGAAEAIEAWSWIDRVEPSIVRDGAAGYYNRAMHPSGRGYTPDNFGPITIPAEGRSIALTEANWPLYGPVIARYEGHAVRQTSDGGFEVDGEPVTSWTFRQDYYFVMGDNRDNSEDSRFWGFVPMDHIVGKAVLIYFSWDKEAVLPRFGRFFHVIR